MEIILFVLSLVLVLGKVQRLVDGRNDVDGGEKRKRKRKGWQRGTGGGRIALGEEIARQEQRSNGKKERARVTDGGWRWK